jgi:membrane protein YqaA with SNARE-associated domain
MSQYRKTKVSKNTIKRYGVIHRYYAITKFYSFLKDTSIKGGIALIVLVPLLIALDYFLLDFNALLDILVVSYSPRVIFLFFFLSETFLGLVPPEIFIAWSAKSADPWFFLFILATVSYIGGIIAYFIGNRLFLIPTVRNYFDKKNSKHIGNLRKWGGLFVFVGAMLPIPHSIVSLACGLIKYDFKHYLLWALFRYLRFLLYALVIFEIF